MAHLQESRFLGYWGLYRRGVIMNITNPKVTLFFLAFLPQFCAPERGSVALQVMELGLLFMLAAFLVFTAVSALGGRLTVQNPPPAVRRMLDLARITYA